MKFWDMHAAPVAVAEILPGAKSITDGALASGAARAADFVFCIQLGES
jgi:hypothetical protein